MRGSDKIHGHKKTKQHNNTTTTLEAGQAGRTNRQLNTASCLTKLTALIRCDRQEGEAALAGQAWVSSGVLYLLREGLRWTEWVSSGVEGRYVAEMVDELPPHRRSLPRCWVHLEGAVGARGWLQR